MVDPDPGTDDPPGFGLACAAIAPAITESLPLDEVLGRIAAAAQLVMPYEAMGSGTRRPPTIR
jgi:hypothetical protein